MAKRLLFRLREKGAKYWMIALIIFFLANTGSSYIYDYLHLTSARSYFFQYLLEWGPKPAESKFVRVVLIEDDEYWLGDLAGRSPIKRDYLAQLVDKLIAANAHVIALDFDTRLPNPDSLIIPDEYREETRILILAIVKAAKQGKKVVLSTPISFDKEGRYRQDSDIYQSYGLCLRAGTKALDENPNTAEFDQATKKNITCGYIARPFDPLVVPSQLPMADGSYLDSFALAIARAMQPELVFRLLQRIGTTMRFGNYISIDEHSDAQLSAHDVLRGTADKEKLEASVVIVGANWSERAAGRGRLVDLHWTPAGWTVGAMLHANFVEAILDSRIFGATPDWVLRAAEIGFSLVAAIAFALIPGFWGKVGGIISLILLLFFVQWAMLHGFGVFFDAFVPVLGLGLHSLYERLFGAHEPATRGTHVN